MSIFVDSSAFISIWNIDDSNHKIAVNKSSRLQAEKELLITSNIVIGEVLTVLSMKLGIKKANLFWQYIVEEKLKTIFVDEYAFEKAWEIFQKRTSKNVSFFDCTSFALMKELRIDRVFSFDTDFKKQRFKLI